VTPRHCAPSSSTLPASTLRGAWDRVGLRVHAAQGDAQALRAVQLRPARMRPATRCSAPALLCPFRRRWHSCDRLLTLGTRQRSHKTSTKTHCCHPQAGAPVARHQDARRRAPKQATPQQLAADCAAGPPLPGGRAGTPRHASRGLSDDDAQRTQHRPAPARAARPIERPARDLWQRWAARQLVETLHQCGSWNGSWE